MPRIPLEDPAPPEDNVCKFIIGYLPLKTHSLWVKIVLWLEDLAGIICFLHHRSIEKPIQWINLCLFCPAGSDVLCEANFLGSPPSQSLKFVYNLLRIVINIETGFQRLNSQGGNNQSMLQNSIIVMHLDLLAQSQKYQGLEHVACKAD